MAVTALDIIGFFERQARRPLTAKEFLTHFKLSRGERQEVVQLIEAMAREGTLVHLKGDRYALPKPLSLVVGKVSVHRDGYGFVAPAAGGGPDVFVPARFLREVMNGDRVAVRIERSGRGGKPEGRVVRVLERAHQSLVGRYEGGGKLGFVVPADPTLSMDLLIPPEATLGARPGQMVVARIEVYPGRSRNPVGSIVEVLGDPEDPEVEILTIVHKYGLPHRFSEAALETAAALPEQVLPAELEGREDLRDLPTVTIDGETARDFDDAVSVRREQGGIRLWVSIADVGHYVPEGGALDLDAYERSTSVYFPGRCLPMLPEKLSNGICSLNPRVERLALTAEMLFDRQGGRVESRFYPSIIRSDARLTYTEVRDMVVSGDRQVIERYAELFPHLQVMAELAGTLTAMRQRRGSLDFDLPEAEIVLDLTGQPENIVRAERTLAHRLIEEFMLAANEAVAAFLTEREAPFLYRIHEPPELEKLQEFQQFIAHFNLGLNLERGGATPRQLQTLLAEVEGRPEERMINQILLRAMKQAHYAPENVGHFGLAADCYCHFTSPIRRYPDLQVHRVLRQVLLRGKLSAGRRQRLKAMLPQMGEETSARERRAMEAEREIVALKKCQFMAERVGEEFSGFVSGVQPFGFFVELQEYFVEGLVHISSLTDDFYQYEEERHRLLGQNRRRSFQIGDEVRVSVARINLERREIDLILAGMGEPPMRGRGRRPTRRQPRRNHRP